MREVIRDKGRIEHMLSAIGNVEEFTKDITIDDFVNSKIIFYAVVKNIEIVGEATYMLTNEFKDSHPSIPWQIIEKMRHVLFMVTIPFLRKKCGKQFKMICRY